MPAWHPPGSAAFRLRCLLFDALSVPRRVSASRGTRGYRPPYTWRTAARTPSACLSVRVSMMTPRSLSPPRGEATSGRPRQRGTERIDRGPSPSGGLGILSRGFHLVHDPERAHPDPNLPVGLGDRVALAGQHNVPSDASLPGLQDGRRDAIAEGDGPSVPRLMPLIVVRHRSAPPPQAMPTTRILRGAQS